MGAGRRHRRGPALAGQGQPGVPAAGGPAGRVVHLRHGHPGRDLRHGQARARGRVLPVPPRGHRVRIIEYTVTIRDAAGAAARTELFRLATTLLDSAQAPAADLAALYHQRWEAENGYAEIKTRLRGAGFILRSRIPDLACQEMWAFLALCQAICQMEYQAACPARIDPGQLSFTVTIRIARDHARTQLAVTTPQGLARARQHAIADMLADLLPPRRDRQCQRAKKRPRNTYPPKKNDQPRPPGNITCHIQVINQTPRASANTLSQRHCPIEGVLTHNDRSGRPAPGRSGRRILQPARSFQVHGWDIHAVRIGWRTPAIRHGSARGAHEHHRPQLGRRHLLEISTS